MNSKYLSLLLIMCFVMTIGIVSTACVEQKKGSIAIKYESKYSKYANKVKRKASQIIDLSDGPQASYDYSLGPSDIGNPSFRVISVDSMP